MASNLDRLREANAQHDALKARERSDGIGYQPGRPERNLNPQQFATDEDKDAALKAAGMELPPEEEARISGEVEGERHRDRMKSMTAKERNEYMAGLRGGIQENDRPKRGDFDNPLRRDQPPEPKPPRPAPQPRQPRPPRQPNPMTSVRKWSSLARKARGRR